MTPKEPDMRERCEREKVYKDGFGIDFPDWYTIDNDGISSLEHALRKHFEGKTVRIVITEVEE